MHLSNPSLIFTQISGYRQTGPWSSRPGYASVCEAESGFCYINSLMDSQTDSLSGPSMRPNISLEDSISGLHAAFGMVNDAYFHPCLDTSQHSGPSTPLQTEKDCSRRKEQTNCQCQYHGKVSFGLLLILKLSSLFDSMLNLMESIILEYDRKGKLHI